VRVGTISLGSLKPNYTRHSFTIYNCYSLFFH